MRHLLSLVAAAALIVSAGLRAGPAVVVPTPLDSSGPQQKVLDATLTAGSSNPRLGMPAFLPTSGDPDLVAAAKTVADVLWADLDFEREFYLIDRAKTANIPSSADPLTLPFERWAEIGADYVVLGSLVREGAEFSVELRFVRASGENRGSTSYGQKYGNCLLANPRSCAHYMADDIHKNLRQLDGVAQTRLAFVSDRAGTRVAGRPMSDPGTAKELFISDYDGANVRQVTVSRSLVAGPAWSPDGTALAYTWWPPGAAPTVVVNTLDGRPVRRLVPPEGDVHNTLPAYSPDGTKIAFGSTRSGNWDIWVANADGSGLKNLTATSRRTDNAPTWSPDGTKIAFTSDRSGGVRLYVMNAEDGLGLDVINTGGDVDRPTWSSQNFIAYTSGAGHQRSISLYDFRTGQTAILTDAVGDNQSPAVSPTGRHVVFTTTRWGREEIAIINRRGENIRRVTNVGNNKSPSWSRPRGR